MNGVHDLGGTDGLGPVPVPKDEPVFRADWETGRSWAPRSSRRPGPTPSSRPG